MANHLAYQQLRRCNLGENRQVLVELGVRLPSPESRVVLKHHGPQVKYRPKPKPKPRPKPALDPATVPADEDGPRTRASFRVQLRQRSDTVDDYFKELEYDEGDEEEEQQHRPKPVVRKGPRIPMPNMYGSIPGVEVGRWWETRMDCNADGVHRPPVSGIHSGPQGAYSVALSGGYEDDIDYGESFTYTGEGGRDLKGTAQNPKNLRTAAQSKDQTLERGNLALAKSVETGNPVRVIRGYKLHSDYAPESGYRYDGLYQVKKFWLAQGKSGFNVYKFAFVRCDQEPAAWTRSNKETMERKGSGEGDLQKEPSADAGEGNEENKPARSTRRRRVSVNSLTEVLLFSDDEDSSKPVTRQTANIKSAAEPQEKSRVLMFMETTGGALSPVKCNTPGNMLACEVQLTDVRQSPNSSEELRVKVTSSSKQGSPRTRSIPRLDPGWLGWKESVWPQVGKSCFHLCVNDNEVACRLIKDEWKEGCVLDYDETGKDVAVNFKFRSPAKKVLSPILVRGKRQESCFFEKNCIGRLETSESTKEKNGTSSSTMGVRKYGRPQKDDVKRKLDLEPSSLILEKKTEQSLTVGVTKSKKVRSSSSKRGSPKKVVVDIKVEPEKALRSILPDSNVSDTYTPEVVPAGIDGSKKISYPLKNRDMSLNRTQKRKLKSDNAADSALSGTVTSATAMSEGLTTETDNHIPAPPPKKRGRPTKINPRKTEVESVLEHNMETSYADGGSVGIAEAIETASQSTDQQPVSLQVTPPESGQPAAISAEVPEKTDIDSTRLNSAPERDSSSPEMPGKLHKTNQVSNESEDLFDNEITAEQEKTNESLNVSKDLSDVEMDADEPGWKGWPEECRDLDEIDVEPDKSNKLSNVSEDIGIDETDAESVKANKFLNVSEDMAADEIDARPGKTNKLSNVSEDLSDDEIDAEQEKTNESLNVSEDMLDNEITAEQEEANESLNVSKDLSDDEMDAEEPGWIGWPEFEPITVPTFEVSLVLTN